MQIYSSLWLILPIFYTYNRKDKICIVSFYFKVRKLIPNYLSIMSSLAMIHIISSFFI